MAEMILRLPAVKARVGLSRSSIYKMVSAREFPTPVRLGPRAVGWLESEVEAWLASRVQLRDSKGRAPLMM
ncbi:MAG: AlpA family transcriptional regulator [Acidobacteriota bacterium]|nr:AlpA family transcriptional regulator [Acidobacteriota bacterium]